MEGNEVPGIQYPAGLSSHLTSKRTSHKIAEQGRRHRINNALKEIGDLLPNDSVKDARSGGSDDGEKKGSSNKVDMASKADKLERAIAYIKELEQQVAVEKRRADVAEAKNATLETS